MNESNRFFDAFYVYIYMCVFRRWFAADSDIVMVVRNVGSSHHPEKKKEMSDCGT